MNTLEHIIKVEIELHSFCNRSCAWCSNSKYLRNKQKIMSDDLFKDILHQLLAAKFANNSQLHTRSTSAQPDMRTPNIVSRANNPVMVFNGYSEPMADIKNLKRKLSIAKQILPKHVSLVFNTSGDYINQQNLQDLYADIINIMDYDCKGANYWNTVLQNLGYETVVDQKFITATKNTQTIKVYLDWPKNSKIENRGGSIDPVDGVKLMNKWEKRIVPCMEPTYHITIGYDGSVVPCCQIRNDIDKHKEYVWGNLSSNSLLNILNSKAATEFRKKLQVENGTYPDPCKFCQKIGGRTACGSPDGWDYIGIRYRKNKINNEVTFDE